MDQVYLTFYRKMMVVRPAAYKAATDRVLGWDFDTMLPCHGVGSATLNVLPTEFFHVPQMAVANS